MIVWVGCKACREAPRGKVWSGRWASDEEAELMSHRDVHQLKTGERMLAWGPHAEDPQIWTLEDFGVPLEQSEEDLAAQARYAQSLDDVDHLAPMAVLAAWLGKDIWDVDYQAFRSVYAGQYQGKVTRALRKRYEVAPAGPGWWYLFRKLA